MTYATNCQLLGCELWWVACFVLKFFLFFFALIAFTILNCQQMEFNRIWLLGIVPVTELVRTVNDFECAC